MQYLNLDVSGSPSDSISLVNDWHRQYNFWTENKGRYNMNRTDKVIVEGMEYSTRGIYEEFV